MEDSKMKILYVEDKPSENIDRIIFLFRKYLSKEIIEQLENMDEDESGFGGSAEDIKQIINSSNSIWFEYNFYQALKVLNNEQNEFALFIIDRNLIKSNYDLDEIRKIEPNYSEEMSVEFLGFEGDYLLHKLIYDVDVLNKFFFLTANSKEGLKNLEEIKKHIKWGKFSSDNFIDKTDNRQKEKLRNIINSHQQMLVQLENLEYINILQKYVGEKASDEFISLLINNKYLKIPEALTSCRRLLESILTTLAEKIKPTNSECWRYKKGKKELKLSTFINHITFEEIVYYSSNTIVENGMKNINTISSEFGAHQDLKSEKMLATKNTVQTLIYNLKDIIIWFNSILGK